jgi:nucleoside-diphosphate-sugar epimerase
MKYKNALITGGTGFIGENLAKYLINNGWEVNLLSRDVQKITELPGLIDVKKIYKYDGSYDSITKALIEIRPKIVFHLAAYFSAEHQPKDLDNLYSGNLVFGSQLLEAMSNSNINTLVNTGTSWEHYKDSDYNPVNLYAATKQAFEKIIDYYVQAKSFKVYTLKLFDTYGYGDRRGKLVDYVISSIQNHKSLIFSPGDQLLDFVHVKDVVRAYERAAFLLVNDAPSTHRRFGISSQKLVSLKEMVELIQKLMSDTSTIGWGDRDYRAREVMKPWTGFKKLDGWEPTVPLEEGLLELIGLNESMQNVK